MKLALYLYFRRIVRSGLTQIDNGRPTLILANHTNTFMDAIVMGMVLQRRIYFFTRGDMFRNKWADKILRSIGLLPVYRLSEGKENLYRNDTSNEEAMDILRKGGAVIIYGEGGSDMAKILRPLKKGPFRLAVMAANELDQAPLMVPIGINYTQPGAAFTSLYLQAGQAIETQHLQGLDDTGRSRAALQLMRQVSQELAPLTWHTTDAENALLADQLLALQEQVHRPSFSDTQALLTRINAMNADETAVLKQQVADFLVWKDKLQLDNAPVATATHLRTVILLLLGALPAAAAWLFHWLPIKISKRIADKKVKEVDFYSSVFLSCAVGLTMIWYIISFVIFTLLFHAWIGLVLLLGLALAGIFYLKAYRLSMLQAWAAYRSKRLRQSRPKEWEQFHALQRVLLDFVKV